MAEKVVTIRLYYNGVFKQNTYSGGRSFGVNRVDVDEFSYTVLMEYVKDYLHFSEIGGVYIRNENNGGWKLVTKDEELIELVNAYKNDEEIFFYVDNVVDKEIEPLVQMQPHVIIRPRENIVKGI